MQEVKLVEDTKLLVLEILGPCVLWDSEIARLDVDEASSSQDFREPFSQIWIASCLAKALALVFHSCLIRAAFRYGMVVRSWRTSVLSLAPATGCQTPQNWLEESGRIGDRSYEHPFTHEIELLSECPVILVVKNLELKLNGVNSG